MCNLNNLFVIRHCHFFFKLWNFLSTTSYPLLKIIILRVVLFFFFFSF